jgi:hypothetical protein
VPTGKLIQQKVSGRAVLAKVCLELGGKNPLIVCDDADLLVAARHATASAFIDAGDVWAGEEAVARALRCEPMGRGRALVSAVTRARSIRRNSWTVGRARSVFLSARR